MYTHGAVTSHQSRPAPVALGEDSSRVASGRETDRHQEDKGCFTSRLTLSPGNTHL